MSQNVLLNYHIENYDCHVTSPCTSITLLLCNTFLGHNILIELLNNFKIV